MNNDVYNPYNMGQQDKEKQNYYGPGYYQHQPNPINYNQQPMNLGGGYQSGIGNMGVIGQGYNNINAGYYSNNPGGGGYYNPYLAQRKREKEIEEARKSSEYQSRIMKKLSKNSHIANGEYDEDTFEEHAKQYNSSFHNMTNEEYLEQNELQSLVRVHEISKIQDSEGGYVTIQENQGIDRMNQEIERNKKKHGLNDDMSMMEYFDIAGEILLDQKIEQSRRSKRNLGGLYDSGGYGKLIDIHSGGHSYFNSMGSGNNLGRLKHHNIDDMEVTLPSNMSEQYTKRKADFINQLLNGK